MREATFNSARAQLRTRPFQRRFLCAIVEAHVRGDGGPLMVSALISCTRTLTALSMPVRARVHVCVRACVREYITLFARIFTSDRFLYVIIAGGRARLSSARPTLDSRT